MKPNNIHTPHLWVEFYESKRSTITFKPIILWEKSESYRDNDMPYIEMEGNLVNIDEAIKQYGSIISFVPESILKQTVKAIDKEREYTINVNGYGNIFD